MAKMLPPLPKIGTNGKPIMMVKKEVVFGHELLKENADTKVNGQPLHPKVQYTRRVSVPIMENHEKKLIDVKRKFGIEGLRAYVSLCYSFNNLETPHEVFEGIN